VPLQFIAHNPDPFFKSTVPFHAYRSCALAHTHGTVRDAKTHAHARQKTQPPERFFRRNDLIVFARVRFALAWID
jgi:hypothetical protein